MNTMSEPLAIQEHPNQLKVAWIAQANELLIARSGEPIVSVPAAEARREVNGYVGQHSSHMMGGVDPALVYANNGLVWRVPIVLTTPHRGQLGIVGVLDVDAHSGELFIPEDFSQTVQTRAKLIFTTA